MCQPILFLHINRENMGTTEIKQLRVFFKETPFTFSGGADEKNFPQSIGVDFTLKVEKDKYKNIFISHNLRTIHFSYRNANIHTGFKAMDRVSLLANDNFLSQITFEELIKVLPKTEAEFDKIISEYKTRMLGEVRYDEFYTFVNSSAL